MSTSDSTLSLNENMESAFNTITSCRKQMANQGMSRSLDAVVTVLKSIIKHMTSNDQRINDIQDDVAEIRSDVANVKADVAEIKAVVAEIRSDVTKLDTRFTKVEADIAEIKSLIIAQNKSLPITIMKTVETMAQKAMQSMN